MGTRRTRLLTRAPMWNRWQTDLDNVMSRRDWPRYTVGLNHLRPLADGVPNGVTLPRCRGPR
jgi:hypothetical protein